MIYLLRRMKKIVFVLILCPLIVCAQKKAKTFTITGKLAGFPDGTEVRLVRNGENQDLAKTTISKNNFLLKGSVKEPVLCFLIIGNNNPVELYVENNKIAISSDQTSPGKYIITGSASHLDFTGFADLFIPLAQQLSALTNVINSTPPGPDHDGLMNTYTNMQQGLQKQIDKFVKDKPHSVVAAFVLNITYQFNEDVTLLENRFNLLDESVRKSEAGKQLEVLIADKKVGAVGTQALDFTQPDTTGTPVSLSSFRGRYVLVDFWASWCLPCRYENPNVVENFRKFNNKNFTVLGVSLDKPGQKEKWIEAIKTDSLTWSHVSDLQFWNNAAAKLYHIQGIPQNLLLDPDGKIIAKNLRGSALQAKLCEIFGCN